MSRVPSGSADRHRLEMVWLELTTRCNLRCRHCYADASVAAALQGRMSLHDWQAVIDEAVDLGASMIQFIGGEPTLHPHFRTLLDYVGKAKLRLVEVYTNATRLTEDIVGCLKNNGAHVAASFYAEQPDVHDAITMRPGSWGRTVAGIERALAAELPVRVGVIEMVENKAHVPQAIAFLKRMGVRDVGVDAERGIGRGRRQIPAQATAEAAASAGEDFSQLCGQCGQSRLCITAMGAIYPCVFARNTPLGLARDGLRAALASPAFAGFRTAMARELQSTSTFCNPGPPPPVCLPDGPQPDVDGPWQRH